MTEQMLLDEIGLNDEDVNVNENLDQDQENQDNQDDEDLTPSLQSLIRLILICRR